MNPRQRALPLVAAWCALLVYAGAFSPIELGIGALVGEFDRNHHVAMRGGDQGMQLVLQHGSNGVTHRHGIVARTLTLFARPANAANPDHVIQFSAPDNSLRAAQLTAPRPANVEQLSLALIETVLLSLREMFSSSPLLHSPPDEPGELLCLRSTVLLI